MMRAYRSSPEGLAAFLRWAGATPWATFGQALEEATDKGWLIPEEIDVDEVQHLRAVVALNREEAAGAHKRIVALEAALHALVDEEPVAIDGRALYCVYCEGVDGGLSHTSVAHTPGCPWVRARGVLSKEGEA